MRTIPNLVLTSSLTKPMKVPGAWTEGKTYEYA